MDALRPAGMDSLLWPALKCSCFDFATFWWTKSCSSNSICRLLSLFHSSLPPLLSIMKLIKRRGHSEGGQRSLENNSGRERESVLCVCCCVVLAVLQHGLRTQCCSSDEESSAAPLFSPCFHSFTPSTPPNISPVPTVFPCLPSHSPLLVSFLHTPRSLPACTLPMWSMCCAPAETCWGSRKREYLQISQMGLSSAPTAHSQFLVNHCYNSCNTQAATLLHTH